MDLSSMRDTAIDLGTMTEMNPRSIMAKFNKKKYMGVCRWLSTIMAKMMRRFPVTAIRYSIRNTEKCKICRSRASENPRSRKVEIEVRLFILCSRAICIPGREDLLRFIHDIFIQTELRLKCEMFQNFFLKLEMHKQLCFRTIALLTLFFAITSVKRVAYMWHIW